MLATLTLAAALIGGPGIVPGDVPPFAALHRAAAPDSLPGPVTLAPRCTGCALEVVVSGLGMVDTSTPPSPIGLQEGTPPTSVNWGWPGEQGSYVKLAAVASLNDHDGECHKVGSDCIEHYSCHTSLDAFFIISGLMRVKGYQASWGGCGVDGWTSTSSDVLTVSGSLTPGYNYTSPGPDPCCGGWIKHVYYVQAYSPSAHVWYTVGQVRFHISCGICYWKTVTP